MESTEGATVTSQPSTATPDGWYDDPDDPINHRRYWNGRHWTEHTAPKHAPPPPPAPAAGHTPAHQPQDTDRFLKPYYQERFLRFDAIFTMDDPRRASAPRRLKKVEGWKGVRTWNWAAAIFSPIWFFAKGMWAKGLMWVALDVLIALAWHTIVSIIVVSLYAGVYGTYDYYRLRRFGAQW